MLDARVPSRRHRSVDLKVRAYFHQIQIPGGACLWVTDLVGAAMVRDRHGMVVSLLDPGTRLSWSHPRHRVFHFLDEEGEDAEAATEEDVAEILALDLAGVDSVLIHCHGGFSRSPAVAMLLAYRGGARLAAIDEGIDWTWADPNRRVLALGERLLGMGNELSDLAWRRTRRRPAPGHGSGPGLE
jgi:predicted protein tyrosine phosphatase